VSKLREAAVTPHVAQNEHARRTSAIDERTTRHAGYAISQRKRKRVEEIFGWIKTIAGLRKTRHRGRARVGWMFTFAAAAYNLVRMRNLAASYGLTLTMAPGHAAPMPHSAWESLKKTQARQLNQCARLVFPQPARSSRYISFARSGDQPVYFGPSLMSVYAAI